MKNQNEAIAIECIEDGKVLSEIRFYRIYIQKKLLPRVWVGESKVSDPKKRLYAFQEWNSTDSDDVPHTGFLLLNLDQRSFARLLLKKETWSVPLSIAEDRFRFRQETRGVATEGEVDLQSLDWQPLKFYSPGMEFLYQLIQSRWGWFVVLALLPVLTGAVGWMMVSGLIELAKFLGEDLGPRVTHLQEVFTVVTALFGGYMAVQLGRGRY